MTGGFTEKSRISKAVGGDKLLTYGITEALRDSQIERVLSKIDAQGNVKTFRLDTLGNKIREWP